MQTLDNFLDLQTLIQFSMLKTNSYHGEYIFRPIRVARYIIIDH